MFLIIEKIKVNNLVRAFSSKIFRARLRQFDCQPTGSDHSVHETCLLRETATTENFSCITPR